MKHYSHYGKAKSFQKPKNHNATTWAFYAINNASITFLKISSIHPELEQLRFVLCYIATITHVGLRKGGISYKSTSKISPLRKHLETSHQKNQIEWIEWEKVGGLGDRRSTKKRSSSTPSNIASSFKNIMFYNKNDPHQIQFEEDLVLFIAKELMFLSFVEAPFLRRLILRQNPCVSFPLKH